MPSNQTFHHLPHRDAMPHLGVACGVRSGAYVDTEADHLPPESTVGADDAKWAPVRKTRPINVLLPATQRWLGMLAPDVKPQALATQFPRLANHIATDWGNPDACRSFMYHLLVDQRGGRRGFPKDVLQDILALRTFYAQIHPAGEGIGAYTGF
jgi:hypothetical protein